MKQHFETLWRLIVPFLALTSCGVTLEERTLRDGLFVHSNRAIEDHEDELPSTVNLKAMEAAPRAAYYGRLSNAGVKDRGHGRLLARELAVIPNDEVHESSGDDDRTLTFADAVGSANRIVIFVHGFNNSASYAAGKTAKLAAALRKTDEGAAILCFTWPTDKAYLQVAVGGVTQKVTSGRLDALINDVYLGDRKNIDLAANVFRHLIGELSSEYPETPIDIVAHSMGTEVVLKSFLLIHYDALYENRRLKSKPIRNVALVGADVGLNTFRILVKPSEQVTQQLLVYLNPADEVLGVSKDLNEDERLGQQRIGDEPFEGITQPISFVEISGRLAPPKRILKSLLVNHNPMDNKWVMSHVCEFLNSGQANGTVVGVRLKQETSTPFQGENAKYFRLTFGR